MAFIKSIGE
jgi:abhydrolase domain-containing protein 17